MSFRGSSTAGALDLLSVWGAPNPSPGTPTQKKKKKNHRREKQSIASQCPMIVPLGRAGIQDRARQGKGGEWQVGKS